MDMGNLVMFFIDETAEFALRPWDAMPLTREGLEIIQPSTFARFFFFRCARGDGKLLETEFAPIYALTSCFCTRKSEKEKKRERAPRIYVPICCCHIGICLVNFHLLGAFAVPLGWWKVGAREFTFQFVAVTLGFALSIFIF